MGSTVSIADWDGEVVWMVATVTVGSGTGLAGCAGLGGAG
jgi:hypothetical protein